jgi:hypothetical protein
VQREGFGLTRTDETGTFELFRRILPHAAPKLTFCGYNSSVFSAINAELGAVWTAALLAGALPLPPVEQSEGRWRSNSRT